jgi:hypothetical protein
MWPPDAALVPQDILHVGEQDVLLVTASPADDLVRTYDWSGLMKGYTF